MDASTPVKRTKMSSPESSFKKDPSSSVMDAAESMHVDGESAAVNHGTDTAATDDGEAPRTTGTSSLTSSSPSTSPSETNSQSSTPPPRRNRNANTRKKKQGKMRFEGNAYDRGTLPKDRYVCLGDGLRRVNPYWFDFQSTTKKRWLGRSILDVMCNDFRGNQRDYYVRAMKRGRILLNNRKVDVIEGPNATKFDHSDILKHSVHRHEPPVLDEIPVIVFEDEHYVVVNKPASLPVHPCGRYRWNSVSELLGVVYPRLAFPPPTDEEEKPTDNDRADKHRATLDMPPPSTTPASTSTSTSSADSPAKNQALAKESSNTNVHMPPLTAKLRSCHRLDRLTSGVLIFSKSKEKATELMEMLRGKTNADGTTTHFNVSKFYVARLQGKLTDEALHKKTEAVEHAPQWRLINQPILVRNLVMGMNKVDAELGKMSQTRIAIVRYEEDTDTTLVLCQPITGRTHQIRVHALWLGFPIANDPIYFLGVDVDRPGGLSDGTFQPRLDDKPTAAEASSSASASVGTLTSSDMDTCTEQTDKTSGAEDKTAPPTDDDEEEEEEEFVAAGERDPECEFCVTPMRDPAPESLYIFLHALAYKLNEYWFETDLPTWCQAQSCPPPTPSSTTTAEADDVSASSMAANAALKQTMHTLMNSLLDDTSTTSSPPLSSP